MADEDARSSKRSRKADEMTDAEASSKRREPDSQRRLREARFANIRPAPRFTRQDHARPSAQHRSTKHPTQKHSRARREAFRSSGLRAGRDIRN